MGAMKLMNKEKKDMDKTMEDMNSDAVLDLLRSETGEDKEMAQAKRDLKVLDMFIKADVSARGCEALMDKDSKKSRNNMLREMTLFMQQVLTAVKLGEGGMVYQIATDLSALSIYTTQAISVMAESPRAYRKRNEYIEGINDWKRLKFLDPTQVEGFKQARDKRQYLSEVTMCPKAIYTLDLTSDIDVDS